MNLNNSTGGGGAEEGMVSLRNWGMELGLKDWEAVEWG